MIALGILDIFGDLLGHLDDLAPGNTLNPGRQPYDEGVEDDPRFAFLTDDALPLDPERAAIVAVIDDAVPFAHERLRVGPAARVASIWFQGAPLDPSTPVGGDLPFGRELRGAQISDLAAKLASGAILDEDALYRASGLLDMGRDEPQRLALGQGHGAAVAGLAAGFGPDEAATARGLPVIAVCLPPSVVRDTLGTVAPLFVTLAILHVIHRARRLCRFIERRRSLPKGSLRLPVVINLSFGLSAGPKDGSSDLEQLMDALSAEAADDLGPVRFVVAIGNHRLARVRARIAAGAAGPLRWHVRPEDATPSFLEIWGPRRAGTARPAKPMQVECRPPGQSQPLATSFVAHGTYQRLMAAGREVARAYLQHRAFERHGREVVTLVIPPTLPERLGSPYGSPGCWQLRVLADGGDFDVFVQRDDDVEDLRARGGQQSRLVDETDPIFDADGRAAMHDDPGKVHGVLRAGTINAYATGREALRVGGRFAARRTPVPFSSLGPDAGASNFEGDVRASAATSETWPVLRVMGSRSGAWAEMTGTSVAAPIVARELARAFAEGVVKDTRHGALAALLRQRLGD